MYRYLGVGLFATLMGTCAIASSVQSAPQITKPVNENQRLAAGDVRPAAQLAKNDRGRVDDDFALKGMRILMHRSTAQQAALDKLSEDLHNPRSPSYHKWLTASQFAQRFGVDKADVDAVRSWLGSHGFHVDSVSRDRTLITFSGNAGQVREAFRTEVHNLVVKGEHHFANTSTPTIPAALKPAVEGLIALNDFRPHPNLRLKSNYTVSSSYHLVVPEDLATIYNFNPTYKRGITGRGQTIAVLEEGDIQDLHNWKKFRQTFGLSNYHGTFTQEQPAGSTECDDPGVNGAEDEANLDAQWSGAAAPDAAIIAAACADSASDYGLYIAMENLLEQANPPHVMSISYGLCEVLLGRTFNHHISNLYQQADAEGVSVFVSTGDEGSAECDRRAPVAVHGISVSGFSSTPYNVAVGGTDFADTFLGTTNLYWNDTNDQYYGSAKSYIPEFPWDDSCANGPLTQREGYSQPYGDTGFCNSTSGDRFIDTVAGSGGPSSCASGRPTQDGVVSGTCAGYQKPSWQTGLSIPSDGVRDTPDVSLMAANGLWGHYYVFCDTAVGSCNGAPSGWPGAGGTSFASPIWAGIQALVNQSTGSAQGNPNPIYYSLANAEYTRRGDAACQSSASNGAASSCIFYDVVLGDNDVDCQGTVNCYLPSGTYGILSTSQKNPRPAFRAQKEYDFTTGLGTPNVDNLVSNWPAQ